MNRFYRFSRVSPRALYEESVRRAWRCAGLALFLLGGGAVAALFTPAVGWVGCVGQAADFAGFLVTAAPPEQGEQADPAPMPLALAPALPPAVSVLPTLAMPPAAAEPQQLPPLEVALWEVAWEWSAEDAFSLPLPAELGAPEAAAPRQGLVREAVASSPHEREGEQGELVAARYRTTPLPPYPASLRSRRAEGQVGLRIELDAEGIPQRVEVSSTSGYALFDRCAREWVLTHWRFHPARRGTLAVASVVHTKVAFCLRSS